MTTLSSYQVAERLGLTLHQVYRRLQRGDIPYTTGGPTGAAYLVQEEDLQAYIDAGQPLSAPGADQSTLSVRETAEVLGLPFDRIKAMCRKGVLEHTRAGRTRSHLRIFRSAVERYMRESAIKL